MAEGAGVERSTGVGCSGTREAVLNLKQQGELCSGQREGACAVDALRIAVSYGFRLIDSRFRGGGPAD